MKDLKIPRLIVAGFIVAFLTWLFHRLLLFATSYFVPFTTWKIETISFGSIFVGATFAMIALLIYNRISGGDEKTKQEIMSEFGLYELGFRITSLKDIEKQRDEEVKGRLDKYALDLRRERGSLMSENMHKIDGSFVEDWRESLLGARKRLMDEEHRLLANNKINIEAAMWMAFIGVALPIYYIFFISELGENANLWTIFASYWPIFSVVFVFEIIAGFFLRAYIQTEHRIERKQNEMTNIELRLTAGLMLSEKTNKEKFAELAGTLSKEERNFVLGKNESSATSEIIDNKKLLEIISKLAMKAGGI